MLLRSCLLFLPLFASLAVAQSLVPQSRVAQSPAPQTQPSFTLGERWSHYLYRTYSWQRMGLLGVDVMADTAITRPQCDTGKADCFADRYAGAFFRRATRTSLEFVAGEVLQEDIRRRPSGRSGLGPRLKFALAHTWTAYRPDGSSRFSYSRLIGAAGGIAVFQGWNERPITTGRMSHQLSWALAANVQDALLVEFGPDMKRLGTGLLKRFRRDKD